MKWLSDEAVNPLREAVELPDLSGTPYRLIRKIASRGMGTVYLAEDSRLGRHVAVKVMSLPDSSGTLASRMLREARIVAQLEHPSIVPIHDVGTLPDGRVFYAMKFVQGSRLDQYVTSGTSPADLLRIFQKVCEAVAFAHAHGVIHRDLKPENIMVGAFGEVLVREWGVAKARIADFVRQPGFAWHWIADSSTEKVDRRQTGSEPTAAAFSHEAETLVMASRAGSGQTTAHGTVLGTPAYMVPEQAMGQTDQLDERTDVYALGAILYFLLTGRPPFEADSSGDVRQLVIHQLPTRPRQRNRKIARRIEAVCLKARSKDLGERYASAQEMAADVARFLDGLPVSAYRENVFERGGRWLGRNHFFVLLILAYLLMRFLVLLFAGRQRESRERLIEGRRERVRQNHALSNSKTRRSVMSKIVLGLILGGVLGILGGLTALFTPEVVPYMMSIIIGSTIKGLITGVAIGSFARKVQSLPKGILFGLGVGMLLSFLVAAMPAETGEHYYFEIMLPGSVLGLIVGFATQRFGRPAQPKLNAAGKTA